MRFIVTTEGLNLAGHRLIRDDVVELPEGMPRLDTLVRTNQLHYYDGSREPVAQVRSREIKVKR